MLELSFSHCCQKLSPPHLFLEKAPGVEPLRAQWPRPGASTHGTRPRRSLGAGGQRGRPLPSVQTWDPCHHPGAAQSTVHRALTAAGLSCACSSAPAQPQSLLPRHRAAAVGWGLRQRGGFLGLQPRASTKGWCWGAQQGQVGPSIARCPPHHCTSLPTAGPTAPADSSTLGRRKFLVSMGTGEGKFLGLGLGWSQLGRERQGQQHPRAGHTLPAPLLSQGPWVPVLLPAPREAQPGRAAPGAPRSPRAVSGAS